MALRIALVDDHQAFRERLRALVEEDPDIEIVAEAGSGPELLEIALSAKIDVACMDISMPGMNGIEATRRLLALEPKARVIGLSAYADPLYVEAMLEAGAVGYFTKGDAGEALLQAIHCASAERPMFGGDVTVPAAAHAAAPAARGAGRAEPQNVPAALGQREREVLSLLAQGQASAQIAASLSIDLALVEVYRRNLMRKLHLDSDIALAEYARRSQAGRA